MADQPQYTLMEAETGKDAVAAALRVQLKSELHGMKQCSYQAYECTQLTLEGYNYCSRHILQDKAAPYKQCAYVYNSNSKRCHLPAPKDKKDSGYCTEHALKLHLSASKRNNQYQPPRTAEVLLNYVSHYIKRPKSSMSSTLQSDDNRSVTPDENEGIITRSLDPFVDIEPNSILGSGNDVLDMCSESESDVEPTVYGSVWHDTHAESSDNDSIDSEQDVLKHANAYTAEEATLIMRDKLKRLQSLYIDQYRYLQHMLREHRRRYLFALKHEKETYCNIYNQVHENAKEQRLYKKLKAYNSYHRRHGTEAVCLKRLQERRVKATDGCLSKLQNFTKCMFTEGGVKCGEKTLPVTRHCPKHILEDPNQILFRVCGKMCGDIECITPVEAIFDDATCRLHKDFPLIRTYHQVRKDSESDAEEMGTSSLLGNGSHLTDPNHRTDIKIENCVLSDPDVKNEISEMQPKYANSVTNILGDHNFTENISSMVPFVKVSINNRELSTDNLTCEVNMGNKVESTDSSDFGIDEPMDVTTTL